MPSDLALEVRGGYIGVEPLADGAAPEVHVSVAYPHPLIGEQSWAGAPSRWPLLLDARTFGFERDLERLWAAGRALGARSDNAVVYGEHGASLMPRGADEVVRHKALDLLGDLYLAGAPLRARVVAERASHTAHVALVQALTAR